MLTEGLWVAAGLAGYVTLWWILAQAVSQAVRDTLPRTDICLAGCLASACTASLAGLFLAFAGWLSGWSLLAAAVALTAFVLRKALRPGREELKPPPSRPPPWSRADALCAVFLVLGAGVYLHPGEPVAGNWDPGVYLAQGAALAQGGTYLYHDTASPLLDSEEKDVLYPVAHGVRMKYPGFYVAPHHPHRLEPQFFPLFPVWIGAVASSGSLRPALYLTAVFSLLSLVLVLKLGERMGGWVCAAAAALLFLLNPVQVWFSGFPTAEVLMQFFFLGGLWSWVLYVDHQHPSAAWLAGTCFALVMFTSVTGLFLTALVLTALVIHLREGRRALGLFVPSLALLPLVAIQIMFFTSMYFDGVSRYLPALHRWLTRPLVVVPVVLVLLGLGVRRFMATSRYRERVALVLRITSLAIFTIAIGCLVYLLATSDPEYAGIRALSAMVSRLNLVAAAAGLGLLVWKRPRIGWTLLAVGGIFTYLFVASRMMSRLYPWAFKRYLAVTLPLVCLCAGYAWSKAAAWCRHPAARVLVLALVLLLGLRLMYRGRAFAFHRDWAGLLSFTERVASAVPPDGVVFADKWIATPLEFIHGRTTVPGHLLQSEGASATGVSTAARRLAAAGHPVYMIYQPEHESIHPLSGRRVFSDTLTTSILNQSPYPFRASPRARTIHLDVVQIEVDAETHSQAGRESGAGGP